MDNYLLRPLVDVTEANTCPRTDIAPSLGPVIGGSITQQLGWRWVFWFLVILTGSHFLVMLLFFPETQRNIVGNGSGRARGIYWSFFSLLQSDQAKRNRTETLKPKRHYPNPVACLPILADKDSLMIILIYAVTYSVKMTLQTSLGAQCVEIYHLNFIAAGLIFLPSGVAGGIGSFMTGVGSEHLESPPKPLAYLYPGKHLDRTYRRTVQKLARDHQEQVYNLSPEFPIEKTRLKGVYLLITISAMGTVGYGLALMTKTVNLTVTSSGEISLIRFVSIYQ